MKVNFYTQNNKNYKNNNKNVAFSSGMTPQIMEQIQKTDVIEISKKLADKDIIADFNGNKVLAWCCDKVVDIFGQIKKKSKIDLALPKEIHVENFDNLKVFKNGSIGFCTVFPAAIYLHKDDVSKERSVFFNTMESEKAKASQDLKKFYDWNNIDELSNATFLNKISTTSHFLYFILHEFTHSAHEKNLENNIGQEDYPYFIYSHNSKDYLDEFKYKYEKLAQKYCKYAGTNPFETIACDMPNKIVHSLNSDLDVVSNPFKHTPYDKPRFGQLFSQKNTDDYFNMIKDFWTGNF